MLNKRARKMVGYDELVKEFADLGFTDCDLDYLTTSDVREFLRRRFVPDFHDMYRFITDVRKELRKDMHEENTVEQIMNKLPYSAQRMAQEAVESLLRKAEEGRIFEVDSTVYALCDVLMGVFHCVMWNIRETAAEINAEGYCYSKEELRDNKLLRDFIENMRDRQWYKHGEVVRLRTRNVA